MGNKQIIEIVLKIIIIFLSALLILSIFNGAVTLFMMVGALGVTYIFIYYWQRRVISLKQEKVQMK